jgi:PAS domain S-box-containing protein
MMADTASLHVLLNSLVDRSRFPNGTIVFQYTLVTEEAVIAGNQIMARWVMSTLNATQCGARMEVGKQGMLCCRFNSAHKITGVELMFDVMALMLQLKQAAGSETFSVIPNTVQTCQRSFDKPMVMTLADEPYTIVQVNKLWEEMTGYKAEEVVGKTSCRILEGEETDPTAVEVLMNEIRFKRPASAMIINCKKSGERFRNFFLAYPLSTDSRITHYLRFSTHVDTVGEASASVPVPQTKQSLSNVIVPAASGGDPQSGLQPKFFGGVPSSKPNVAGNQTGATSTQPLQQPLQPSVQQPVYSITPVLSESLPASSTTSGMILPPGIGVKSVGAQQYSVSSLKRPSPSANAPVGKQQKRVNDMDGATSNGKPN